MGGVIWVTFFGFGILIICKLKIASSMLRLLVAITGNRPMSSGTLHIASNRVSVVALLASLCFHAPALAQTTQWVGVASSDWRTPSNWSSGIPTSAAKTLVSNGEPTHRDLVVPAPSFSDTARTGELTISFDGRMTFAPAPQPGLLIVHGSALSLNGGELFLGEGSIVFRNDVTLNNGGTINGGTGTLEFQGNVTAASGSLFDPGTGTVTLSGSGDQTISGNLQFNHLVVESEGTVSLNGSISVLGSVTVAEGSTLIVESGATFEYEGEVQGGGTIVNENELPVQMASLTATHSGSHVILRWSTATETDNHGFTIERRPLTDISGTSGYEPLAFVLGAGTSATPCWYEFADQPGAAGRYAYRVTSVDRDGTVHQGFDAEVVVAAPVTAELFQNHPNPFNPSTTVRYQLPQGAWIVLTVVDLLGRRVATPVEGERSAGSYSTVWNASAVPSGIYFCRLETAGRTTVRRMQLVK